ncbi:MAG: hypothetical protein FWE20_11795 [Defluviitaleaceae bacterium]|nr:hypothetical protein [Defluviitaleaceae bacterium]
MARSVLIPISLVKQIIELLEHWDISKYDRVVRNEYSDILNSGTLVLR